MDYATVQQWAELAGWVDWLVSTYDLLMSRSVLPCWPAHLGVVEELAALRGAWWPAATTARIKEPNDALAQWHDGLLHPCLLRLRQAFQQKSCEDRHTTPRPGHTTDVELLAPALAAAARRPAPSGKLPG